MRDLVLTHTKSRPAATCGVMSVPAMGAFEIIIVGLSIGVGAGVGAFEMIIVSPGRTLGVGIGTYGGRGELSIICGIGGKEERSERTISGF